MNPQPLLFYDLHIEKARVSEDTRACLFFYEKD